MLTETGISIPEEWLVEAQKSLMDIDFKLCLNKPTQDFFYDPWIIKDEYKDTIWDKILSVLPNDIGEARLIKLGPACSYHSHADMDDRYHLNIMGKHSYLLDLTNNIMHPIVTDCKWYSMNAGLVHTAANFSNTDRVQLVVRKLLLKNVLKNPVYITIMVKENVNSYRFQFDNTISPWLNIANKNGIVNNFVYKDEYVSFNIERDYLEELQLLLPDIFKIV